MFEQKKTKQDEQNLAYSSIESPEVRKSDPLAPFRPHIDRFDISEDAKLDLVGAILTIADMVLDRKFGAIKYPHLCQNSVDEVSTSINGDRHEN